MPSGGKSSGNWSKEIAVAARLGGGRPGRQPQAQGRHSAAKQENMPKDNIQRAIAKGAGEGGGANLEEVIYEGYGPEGVAIMVDSLTDNKNRTVSDLRHLFTKYGGSMGEPGCVSWMFDKKGVIVFDQAAVKEDELLEAALDSGAEDISNTESQVEVLTDPGNFLEVREALEKPALSPSWPSCSCAPGPRWRSPRNPGPRPF